MDLDFRTCGTTKIDALEGAYNQIKLRIWDQYKQTWCANLNNSSRLSSYSRYKHIFCQDQYLHIISQPKYRIALTKFRISAHDLEIERGRHVNIDRVDRICSYCNQNVHRIGIPFSSGMYSL